MAAVGSAAADFEHFTWWSIAGLAIYGTLEELNLGIRYFWFYITISTVVIAGVNIMGVDDCDVFETAYRHLGPTKYILGNFTMHYLNQLIVVALSSNRHIFCGEDSAWIQIWCAVGVFIIWHHIRDPWIIYGCSLPHSLGILGMLVISICITIIAVTLQDEW